MATDILTIKEAAEFLKLTEKTAYRLAADGKTSFYNDPVDAVFRALGAE
jgi:hypothetical protein